MKDLLVFIDQHPGAKEYMPDDEELPKAGKDWVANMLYTLYPRDFQYFILGAEQARRAKVDEQPIDTKRLVVHRRVELDNGTVVQRDVVDHELSRINSNRSDELLIAKTALVPSETTAQRCADRQRRVEAIGVDELPLSQDLDERRTAVEVLEGHGELVETADISSAATSEHVKAAAERLDLEILDCEAVLVELKGRSPDEPDALTTDEPLELTKLDGRLREVAHSHREVDSIVRTFDPRPHDVESARGQVETSRDAHLLTARLLQNDMRVELALEIARGDGSRDARVETNPSVRER